MSASFSSALGAALEAAGAQHYPQGTLYVVATPIGNLADISLRALHVLALADRVACEDTRHTQALLRAYGIDKPGAQLLAVHQHNEAQAAHAVVDLLRAGLRVAYVSDAGTPGVSDPGARLVAHVRAQGLRVVPLPVSAPFHSPLMAPAALRLREALEGVQFRAPKLPIRSTVVDGFITPDTDLRELLVLQMTAPVLWQEAIAALAQAGATKALALGPAAAVPGLVKRTARGLKTIVVSEPPDLEKLAG